MIKNHIPSQRYNIVKQVLDKFLNITFEEIQKIGFCSFLTLFYDNFDMTQINNIQTLLKFDIEF